jgi:hypothetical protein
LDLKDIKIPVTRNEVLRLPIDAAGVGYLTNLIEQSVAARPETRDHPTVVRLQTMLQFLFASTLMLGAQEETLKEAGRQGVIRAYEELKRQKELLDGQLPQSGPK